MKHFYRSSTRNTIILSLLSAYAFSPSSQAASISDLLITEVMANPSAVTDTLGEWFELFNPTNEAIDINGITLSDDGGNRHDIASDESIFINPGSFFVMARNGDSNTNGGFTPDYIYNNFSLSNTSDQIIFSTDSRVLLRLDYTAGFVSSGISAELADNAMLAGNYVDSITPFGLGDLGSPGAAGAFDVTKPPAPVPLPGAAWLITSGLFGLIGFKRRQKTLH